MNYCLQHGKKTHYGHSADVQHLRILKQQLSCIASKLINGVSVTKIIDQNRNKIGNNLKCIDLLMRQDVAYIKNRYNLIITEGIRHKWDSMEFYGFMGGRMQTLDRKSTGMLQKTKKGINFLVN